MSEQGQCPAEIAWVSVGWTGLSDFLTDGEVLSLLKGRDFGVRLELSCRGYRILKGAFSIVVSGMAIAPLTVSGTLPCSVRANRMLGGLQARNEDDGPMFKMGEDPHVISGVDSFTRRRSLAAIMTGKPSDAESTKYLSHPENYRLGLQKCRRRPGTSLGACRYYASFQFSFFAVFVSQKGASGRFLCARARLPFASVGTAA